MYIILSPNRRIQFGLKLKSIKDFMSCSMPNNRKAGNTSPEITLDISIIKCWNFIPNTLSPKISNKDIKIRINATKAMKIPKNFVVLQHKRKNGSFFSANSFIVFFPFLDQCPWFFNYRNNSSQNLRHANPEQCFHGCKNCWRYPCCQEMMLIRNNRFLLIYWKKDKVDNKKSDI